jgi:hypothetical protein
LGPGIVEDVVLLVIAEDEDVVLPPVVFPAAVVLFPDVAFRANVDFVVKFSAAIILMASMAAMIKPPNLSPLTNTLLFIRQRQEYIRITVSKSSK